MQKEIYIYIYISTWKTTKTTSHPNKQTNKKAIHNG